MSGAGCTIVFYHYVRDAERTAFPDIRAMSVSGFAAQLDWLQARFDVIDGPDREYAYDEQVGWRVNAAGTAVCVHPFRVGMPPGRYAFWKNVAKVALPAAGAALGSALLPGVGTAIGGKLGSLAGGLLEVGEAEMMGEAEAQFEAAHRFVQFGRATARNAAMAPPNARPKAVAKAAATAAARKHAPGLLRPRPQNFRDRRTDRRQPGRRPGDQQAGRRQRPSQSYRGQPPRRRPIPPPWQWGQWQPGQWQPSDAWLGWAPEPGGAGPGGAPWDQADSYADGDGAGGNGSAGSGNGGNDDRGDSSGFEFG